MVFCETSSCNQEVSTKKERGDCHIHFISQVINNNNFLKSNDAVWHNISSTPDMVNVKCVHMLVGLEAKTCPLILISIFMLLNFVCMVVQWDLSFCQLHPPPKVCNYISQMLRVLMTLFIKRLSMRKGKGMI